MKKQESEIKLKLVDEKFHRIVNKMNRIEKVPRDFGTGFVLHPSEIHTIEVIGNNSGINVTELAEKQGVTKGAVSQIISRLEKKKLIIKMKEIDNDRKICLKLSDIGWKAYQGHLDFHAQIHYPLVEMIEKANHDELDFMVKFFSVLEEFCDKTLDSQ